MPCRARTFYRWDPVTVGVQCSASPAADALPDCITHISATVLIKLSSGSHCRPAADYLLFVGLIKRVTVDTCTMCFNLLIYLSLLSTKLVRDRPSCTCFHRVPERKRSCRSSTCWKVTFAHPISLPFPPTSFLHVMQACMALSLSLSH